MRADRKRGTVVGVVLLACVAAVFGVAAVATHDVDARISFRGNEYYGPSPPLTRTEARRRLGPLVAAKKRVNRRRAWLMRNARESGEPTLVLLERGDGRLEIYSLLPRE